MLFILTVNADGNIPVAFRCTDGNISDSRTHIETWNALRAVAGRADFLYVADSKLCSRENMDAIERAGGRFVTVMPRNRREDQEFRRWIQTNTPDWSCVWDRPNPRYREGPRDRWFVYRAPLLSAETWSVVWVWSSLLTLRQEDRRRRNIAAASEALEQLRQRIAGTKSRLRGAAEIDFQVKTILDKYFVGRVPLRQICMKSPSVLANVLIGQFNPMKRSADGEDIEGRGRAGAWREPGAGQAALSQLA